MFENDENEEGATLVTFESLLSDEIGDKVEEVEQELKEAIEGKEEDPFNFNNVEDQPSVLKTEKSTSTQQVIETPNTQEEVFEQEVEKVNNSTIGQNEEMTSKIYHQALKSMFGENITHIIQTDEQGNETEVELSQVILDKETFEAIVSSKMEDLKEEMSRDKISVKGVSDITRDLIEIDKRGGNITELLRVKEQFTDPLDNLDITTPEGQKLAIFLRKKAKGQDDEEISLLIQSYESQGLLEEKAIAAESELRQAIKAQIDNEKARAKKLQDERKELLKNYKRDLRKGLDVFEMNDTVKNKVVLLATKTDDKGHFEIDRAYDDFRSDPEKAAKLALFLLDTEEYDRQVTNKVVQQTKLSSAKKVRLSVKTASDSPTLVDQTKKEDNTIIRADDII